MQLCILCKKPFESIRPTKKYCGQSCVRKAYRINHPDRDKAQRKVQYAQRRLRNQKPLFKKRCGHCGLLFLPNKKTPYQTYCSVYCQRVSYRKNHALQIAQLAKNDRKKHAEHISDYNLHYKDELRFSSNRLLALQRDEFTCQECGIKSLKLVVHHIDGSGSSNHPDNRLQNLKTLCRSCHIKIHAHNR